MFTVSPVTAPCPKSSYQVVIRCAKLTSYPQKSYPYLNVNGIYHGQEIRGWEGTAVGQSTHFEEQ